jgi:hypothetical protein
MPRINGRMMAELDEFFKPSQSLIITKTKQTEEQQYISLRHSPRCIHLLTAIEITKGNAKSHSQTGIFWLWSAG